MGISCTLGACVWIFFIDESTSSRVYGVAALSGIGGSTVLVTSLAMTSDLIDQYSVSQEHSMNILILLIKPFCWLLNSILIHPHFLFWKTYDYQTMSLAEQCGFCLRCDELYRETGEWTGCCSDPTIQSLVWTIYSNTKGVQKTLFSLLFLF